MLALLLLSLVFSPALHCSAALYPQVSYSPVLPYIPSQTGHGLDLFSFLPAVPKNNIQIHSLPPLSVYPEESQIMFVV